MIAPIFSGGGVELYQGTFPQQPAASSALIHVRVAWDDADFVIEDLLRPHRERFWGYATHVEKHEEARGSLLHSLSYALHMLGVEPPEEPPPDRGDPSGSMSPH